jgi:hypothetical protein
MARNRKRDLKEGQKRKTKTKKKNREWYIEGEK